MGTGTVVMGIDPGTEKLGFCALELMTGPIPYRNLEIGVIQARGRNRDARWPELIEALGERVTRHEPDFIAVEDGFVGRGGEASLALGEARGIVIALAHLIGAKIMRIKVSTAKKAAFGRGDATKQQVQGMVRTILGLVDWPPLDASDAGAVAIAAANRLGIHQIRAVRS